MAVFGVDALQVKSQQTVKDPAAAGAYGVPSTRAVRPAPRAQAIDCRRSCWRDGGLES